MPDYQPAKPEPPDEIQGDGHARATGQESADPHIGKTVEINIRTEVGPLRGTATIGGKYRQGPLICVWLKFHGSTIGSPALAANLIDLTMLKPHPDPSKAEFLCEGTYYADSF